MIPNLETGWARSTLPDLDGILEHHVVNHLYRSTSSMPDQYPAQPCEGSLLLDPDGDVARPTFLIE